MRRILTILTICTVITGGAAAIWACGTLSEVRRALSNDPAVRAKAVSQLREMGPFGLEELVQLRDQNIEHLAGANEERAATLKEQIQKLNALIDEVGGAKYCSASKLYWYTDFEAAKEVAARTNKPILSLRMLGKLNEEFSCANSRFFRTTLYANEEISATLRNKFVLHWESVRPVPRVTIDFGDGRKLERTLTGNSIHYVVDKEGRPLDGLPGLHGPAAFQKWLKRAESLAAQYARKSESERDDFLRRYHGANAEAVREAFTADLARIRGNGVEQSAAQAAPANVPPKAEAAANIAMPKRRAEIGIIRAVAVDRPLPENMDELDEATWKQIAALHAEDAALDRASVELIRSENPNAVVAGRLAFGKALMEDPLARLVRSFQTSIAVDTVRNEYVLHRKLHQWFANGEADSVLYALNERVYAELFLTPSSDPWLGLMTPNTYTALGNNGVVTAPVQQ